MRNSADDYINGPKPLEKSVKILAFINVIVGAFVFILQFAVAMTWIFALADWISTGFWGGLCFLGTGSLILRRRNGGVVMMAITSILCGLAMLGVYIWNLSIVTTWGCGYCGWRYTADILFIISGTIAVIVNAILAKKAKTIQPVYPVYPVTTNAVVQMQSYPITTTTGNVTYVNGQPMYPVQTVGTGPYYGQQQVVVTSSNTFAYPNQPQPVYYPANQQQLVTPAQSGFIDAPPAYAYNDQKDPANQNY